MASSNTKLHPIYVALDSHNYSRAIKLALPLPETNVLGKALLAHAYAKNGQKYQALITLNKVLRLGVGDTNPVGTPSSVFFELKYELDHCLEATVERQNASTLSPASASTMVPTESAPSAGAAKKSGKKGKKKPAAAPAPKQSQPPATPETISSSSSDTDLIDQLNTHPSLLSSSSDHTTNNTDALKLPDPGRAITDDTTLATLNVTLQSLKLTLTAYQMYAWAASSLTGSSHTSAMAPAGTTATIDAILTKTFALGLNVLAAPTKWDSESQAQLERHILANMQTTALQWARFAMSQQQQQSQSTSSTFDTMLATAWASQSALWQLRWLPDDEQRSMILPRLAESMARRLLQQEQDGQASAAAEILLLCLRTLEVQSKWEEMLGLLEALPINGVPDDQRLGTIRDVTSNISSSSSSSLPPASSDFGVALTKHEILTERAKLLRRLGRWNDARAIYETLLHKESNPDDWSCWKGHLEASIFLDDTVEATQALVERTIEEDKGSNIQLRGPHLMMVELAAERVRRNSSMETYQALGDAIKAFAVIFAHRASCAFSDLDQYLSIMLRTDDDAAVQVISSLLGFAESLRKATITPTNKDEGEGGEACGSKERQSKLRAYIFAIKFTHKLLSNRMTNVIELLPDWTEIVREWQATLLLSSSSEGEETQRELKPGDDLILLAVQQLLYEAKMSEHTSSNPLFVSTILLESALRHSPDNAYLKFLAIEVYRQMDAAARSWEYFQMICLKHIQLDTCTFTVLPYLLEGGLYNEIIEVCSALLRFHGATARDCGDYASRAMEAGTLSKADEFMEFQRLKMNQSLTLQYSKGLILDSAPLLATAVPSIKNDENPFLKGGLGITQGIVGGKEDMERAIQMVVESHNPYASLSIVSWANHCGSLANVDVLSDNRDLSILTQFSTLVMPVTQTKEAMVQETLLRGHVHGLLIRATVCLDAMRGPKKGKVVKSSPALERRTQSLLSCVLTASEMVDHQMVIRNDTVRASQKLLRAFLDLCRLLAVINAGMPRMDEDSMEQRENRAADMLSNHAIITLKQAREELVASTSIKIVCALLPSSIVPMFAVFRMCSDVCTAYGWGKRKLKTKKVAGALAEYAREFNLLLQDMINCVKKLPKSDSEPTMNFDLSEKERSVLDESDVRLTAAILTVAQHRTRIRIEPILQEMDEYLEEFDVTPDE